jgi:5'-3' exonuclease
MGIPAYFSYLIKNYNSIINNLNKLDKEIYHFYLDSNSIIYDALHSVEFNNNNYEEQVIKYTCEKIEYYIQLIKPKKSIFIAFDGVAPVAKLEQQRTRRYKSQFIEQVNKEILPEHKKTFDRCAITPGTNFMNKLCIKIKNYFSKPSKYNVDSIFVSCSDESGEGEHKIYQHIRNNSNDETSIVYGLDADLIMLTLNHLKYNKNLYLFRETPEFIKSIDKSLNPNELYLLNIPKLKNIISNHFFDNSKNDTCSNYIFLCFFLGNDFLPHFPALNIRTNGIKNLNDTYVNVVTNNNLIEDDNLNWGEIKNFIKELSKCEEEFLIEEYAIRSKFKKRHFNPDDPKYLEERFNNLPILDMKTEEYIDPYKPNWQHRYYDALFNIEYDKDIIKNICINYLEGLEWTFKYYNKGCPDWTWYYKYHYPPLLEDLVKYIPTFNTSLIEDKVTYPIHEYTQLSYVLPKNSLNLLPNFIQKVLSEKYSDLHNDNCKIIWHFCRYFWESHVDMPHIDINELNRIIKLQL